MQNNISIKDQFLLDPSVTFLNHGSFGATPIPVFEEYQRLQRELEREPVEFLGRKAALLLQRSRETLANYLFVDRDDIVYVPNATHGINIVAHSVELHPGDEVLSTDHEYGAMDRTWQFLSEQKGFRYKNFEISLPVTSTDLFVDQLFSEVTSKTRIIYLSHITSPTALIFPVQQICQKARELGILTIIDGAHAPGQIDLDLGSLGADFYTGNCHKWLCAPKGSAFLYTRKDVQKLVQPLVVSWGWHADVPGPSPYVDYLEWTGTRDISPFLAVPTAIAFQKDHDWSTLRNSCHNLAVWLNKEVSKILSTESLSSSPEWFKQMVSIPLPNLLPAEVLQHRLFNDYKIEVPIVGWKGKNLIRVSIQAYNSLQDLEKLITALGDIFTK
jgi:isopenicillin-N epimerase